VAEALRAANQRVNDHLLTTEGGLFTLPAGLSGRQADSRRTSNESLGHPSLHPDTSTCRCSQHRHRPAGHRPGQDGLPRHQGIHLRQEPLAAGDLLLVLMLSLGERDLLHRIALPDGDRKVSFYPVVGDQAAAAGVMQRLLRSGRTVVKMYTYFVRLSTVDDAKLTDT